MRFTVFVLAAFTAALMSNNASAIYLEAKCLAVSALDDDDTPPHGGADDDDDDTPPRAGADDDDDAQPPAAEPRLTTRNKDALIQKPSTEEPKK